MSGKLTATILTRNEAHNIGDCIASLADLADQVIVLDSGSTDATRDIARARGAIVIEDNGTWPGFGPQKNRALDHATGQQALLAKIVGFLFSDSVNFLGSDSFLGKIR